MKHPAEEKRCTKRQVEVFDQIASGVTNPSCHPSTINALSLKGLIAADWELTGRDAFGEIRIPRWYVPIPVHMQWCNWCLTKQSGVSHD